MTLPESTAFAPVAELAKLLRAGSTTSRELTEFFLNRLQKYGGKYNAVATLTKDRALAEAKRAEEELTAGTDRGPLHGIPYAAKDLFATKGIPTSWGAPPFAERVIEEDAAAIEKLREAGAVLVAKVAMIEIAGGMGYRQANASHTGPALNPWNIDYWRGALPSGSGAAVSAGLVPFALGTETWGSILCPAAFCGVAGLRPTYGRVSRRGAMALSWTMDKIGVLARTADDAGVVLSAMAGPEEGDPSASPVPYEYPLGRAKRNFRLATIKGSAERVHPDVRRGYEESLPILREIAELTEIEFPDDIPWNEVPGTIIDAEIAAAFEGMITSQSIWELAAPEDRHGAHAGQAVLAVDYINALRLRQNYFQPTLDELMKPFDAVVTPARTTPAYHAGKPFRESSRGYSGSSFDGGANCCGLPAITIPSGFGEGNLPVGLQITGRAFDDALVVQIAEAFQTRTTWHKKTPSVM